MRKLNHAVDRFALEHPRFGIPNLMRYIIVGNVIVFFLLRMSGYAAVMFLGVEWGQIGRAHV